MLKEKTPALTDESISAEPVSSETAVEVQSAEDSKQKCKKEKKQKKTSARKKRSKKKLIIIIICAILVIAAAVGCYFLFFTEEERIAMTETTTYGSLNRAIEGSGTTTPLETLTITPVSNAEILEVYVSPGDFVEVGDLLYSQDDSEVDDRIENLYSQIETVKEEILEYENMIEDNEESILDYYDTIADYNEQIAEIYENINNLTVTAPYSGHISNMNLKVGDNVSNGFNLATITNDIELTITQYYSYIYKDQVYIGMPAVVSVADQMMAVQGTVTDISWIERVSESGMSSFSATVKITNPGSFTENTSASCYLVADDNTKIYPTITGKLSYADSERITASASGEVSAVYVSDYSLVNKGDVLFVISGDSLSNQLEQTQSQIERTESQITSAEKQITNYEERITSSYEKIAELEEDIVEAEESRSDYLVAAEISGKVMYVQLEAGDKPNMMRTAITIYNLETMTLSVNIDELDVDYLTEDMTVTVSRTSAEKVTNYEGKITYISPEASSSSGVATFPVTIEVYSNSELASGVNVTYSVNVGDTEESVLAPISALKSTEQGYCLFVKADKAPANAITLSEDDVEVPEGFYAVPVEVGSSNNSYIRILSGVNKDTEVFTRYRQSAPKGGNTTSEGMGEEEFNFEDMFGGQMPDFGGDMSDFSGGNMPSFGGDSGSSSRPSMPSGGNMPSFGN